MRLFLLMAALLCAPRISVTGEKQPAPARVVFEEGFEQGLKKSWKEVKFQGLTQYAVAAEGTNSFLAATANKTASGLATEVAVEPKPGTTLSWRWKIDQIPPGGSDIEIKKFDHTARLFVAFKTFIGPPKSINYVWANATEVGKTFHHPSLGRSRFIVLQNGNAKAGQWIRERRDLVADWKTLFGDSDPPQIVGVGLMTDSDGTGAEVHGGYDDIVLAQPK